MRDGLCSSVPSEVPWWLIASMSLLLTLCLTLAVQAPARLPGIAVERRLAARLDLSVGDTVRLGPAPDSLRVLATVAAVYEPRPDPAEVPLESRRIRMHLPDLAALLGVPDRVDRFGVALRPGVSPDSAVAVLDRTALGYQAYSSREIASGSSQTFRVVSRFHRAIAVISIVASAIFLLCIMLLKVEERRMDAAVMRFIGVRRRTIFGALVLEAAQACNLRCTYCYAGGGAYGGDARLMTPSLAARAARSGSSRQTTYE